MAELRFADPDTRTLKEILDSINEVAVTLDYMPCRAIQEDIAEIAERFAAGGWISVDDALPTETGNYLVAVREPIGENGETTSFVLNAWFDAKTFPYSQDIGWTLLNEFYEFTIRIRERITHWMPLPKPPIVEVKDDA